MYLATFESDLNAAADRLKATRPTAVNLAWAIDAATAKYRRRENRGRAPARAFQTRNRSPTKTPNIAAALASTGVELIRKLSEKKSGPVNILTHCNAGLACVRRLRLGDFARFMRRTDAGIPVHVWVDRNTPRSRGLETHRVGTRSTRRAHTVIADNTGGHLMQRGKVDAVMVGTDRTTYTGDVANKIGTYLKALAAKDNGVPFYVALPSSSFRLEHSGWP